jgi:hypothetical protein
MQRRRGEWKIQLKLIEKCRTRTMLDSHKSVMERVRIADVGRVLSGATGTATVFR